MDGESVETTGFDFFPTIEQYLDRPNSEGETLTSVNRDDIQEWVAYLAPYLRSENIRFSAHSEFPKHVVDSHVEGEGVSWLGNPLVLCAAGIQRSALTRKFLSPFIEGGNTIINDKLPTTATGGFSAQNLTRLVEDRAVRVEGNNLVLTSSGDKIDTIVFHLNEPVPDFDPEYDLSTNSSIGNMVKMLNLLLPQGGQLDTRVLFVVGDEGKVSNMYKDEYGVVPDTIF